MQQSLIMAPETFCAQLKPFYTKMIQRFKETKPDIISILHCDGVVATLLNDFREMGLEVLNPVQPDIPVHLPKEMKNNSAYLFSFW